MNQIQYNNEKKVYSLELSNDEYKRFLELKSENTTDYICQNEGYYFQIYSPRDMSLYHRYAKNIIEFDRYAKSKINLGSDFDYISEMITFDISKYSFTFKDLKDYTVKSKKMKIKFSVENSKLIVKVTAKKEIIESNRLSSAIFHYFFFVSGVFLDLDRHIVYYQEDGNKIDEYMYPKFSDYKNNRYTRFNLSITSEFIEASLIPFIEVYNNNIYPIETFFNSQTDIKYNVQQRVSLILNSLEGLIKRRLSKNDKSIPMSKSDRKKVLNAIQDNALEYVKSDEFAEVISSVDLEGDLKVKERISNSLGRFSELTFNETLELSKTINPSGFNFVKKIKPMPVKFWKRCKDHRNFHAHLTDDNHNGFNGVQSVYAVFILSNYFRLLVLELTGINELNDKLYEKEYTDINTWIVDNNLVSNINQIEEE